MKKRATSSSKNLRENPGESGSQHAGQPSPGGPVSKSAGRTQDAKGQLPPGLYIVATPIGNLGDISQRALDTLRGADVIACEDTRVTGVLLQRFSITTPMTPYHDHNAERVRPLLLERMQGGQAVALVSDAGTPLISDPGYKLVRACAEAGIAAVPLPGPSALLAALTVAALPTDRIMFAGFLPNKSGARKNEIMTLRALPATLVFYEAPGRVAETLADLAAVLGARDAAVCRELTKLHEEVRRGTLAALAQTYAAQETPRGEIVIVVAGAPAAQAENDSADLDGALRAALENMSVRDAAAAVAEALNQPRRTVYARALELSKETGAS